jgi:uncharacterized phosphosugar-binding protein
MKLAERYWAAIDDLFAKVRNTQMESIEKAADIVVDSIQKGGKIYLSDICHSIEMDSIYRGGGPIFYKKYDKEKGIDELRENDVILVSSVSGRTKAVVDLAYDCMQKGVRVIAFTSMEYATQVEAVHESGKKLYEFVTLTLDNCAPAAEAMLQVDGVEARFGAASGMASNYIMWSITSCVVEKMLSLGMTPGILKSANFPGGREYNHGIIEPHYEEYGY